MRTAKIVISYQTKVTCSPQQRNAVTLESCLKGCVMDNPIGSACFWKKYSCTTTLATEWCFYCVGRGSSNWVPQKHRGPPEYPHGSPELFSTVQATHWCTPSISQMLPSMCSIVYMVHRLLYGFIALVPRPWRASRYDFENPWCRTLNVLTTHFFRLLSSV